MTEALLGDSNILSSLPDDAHVLTADALQAHLAGKMLKLGWFLNVETETHELTIGVLDDDSFVFKGDKWEAGKINKGIRGVESSGEDQEPPSDLVIS